MQDSGDVSVDSDMVAGASSLRENETLGTIELQMLLGSTDNKQSAKSQVNPRRRRYFVFTDSGIKLVSCEHVGVAAFRNRLSCHLTQSSPEPVRLSFSVRNEKLIQTASRSRHSLASRASLVTPSRLSMAWRGRMVSMLC